MTPEQRLEILEAALNRIASIDDGDVASLIKSNRLATDALDSINMKRWQVVIETLHNSENLAKALETYGLKVLSVTSTESYT
jgi:hypothetical protein